jgi:hypothetical protein
MSFQNWYKSCIAGGTAVTMKVGPKVAVLMTPFVLEGVRVDTQTRGGAKHVQRGKKDGH